jgi:hypothetical protein
MYTIQRDEIRLLTGYTAFHTCNYFIVIRIHTLQLSNSGPHLSYQLLRCRDQEDHGSNPVQAHILYFSFISYKMCWEMETFFFGSTTFELRASVF